VSGGLVEVTTAETKKTRRGKDKKAEGDDTGTGLTSRGKVAKLLHRLEATMATETPKANLGDFIRLVQLERELADEETPREIRVTWVEPRATSESET
jgi:hypothetical protein